MIKSSSIRSPQNRKRFNAFTLIEMLVSVSLIAVLASSGAVAYSSAQSKGRMTREVAAGKNLATAYSLYAAENNGQLMRGFDKFAENTPLPNGDLVENGAHHRYPHRLAPYFGYKMDGVILVNSNREQVKQAQDSRPAGLGYYESLAPAFGINSLYVGGHVEDARDVLALGDAEVATRLTQVEKPSSLVVFATARTKDSTAEFSGRFAVKAPRFVARAPGSSLSSPDWPQNGSPEATGFLDPRHANEVLCVFLDGSVRSMSMESLKDMRYWSHLAAATNNANYAPTLTGGSTGGGRPGGR